MDYSGVTHIHHLFLPRAAHALAAMWRRANAHTDPRLRHMLLYLVEQAIWGMSILNRYGPTHYSQVNRQLTGVYYVSSQISEVSPNVQSWKQAIPADQDLRRRAGSTGLRTRRDGEHDGVARDSRRLGGLRFHRPAVRREHLLRRSQLPGGILARGADQRDAGGHRRPLQE